MTSAMYVGTAIARLMLSAPTRMPATKTAAATTPSGLQLRQHRDHDAAVAVARRHVERHVSGAPGDLDRTARARPARPTERGRDQRPCARRARRRTPRARALAPTRAHLEAERREAPSHGPERARASASATSRPGVHARALDELRQLELVGKRDRSAASPSRPGPSSVRRASSTRTAATMKLSSSVVTTSSTSKRVLSNAGPSSSSAPASIAAAIISGNSTDAGSESRTAVQSPTATAASAPT